MVQKPGKRKSKRTPVRLRHKIEKASAAKQRKDRKAGKKNPEWQSRLKKDPGIPNLFPFKEKILHEIEEKRRLKEEAHAKQRAERRALEKGTPVEKDEAESDDVDDEDISDLEDVDENDEDMAVDSTNPMAALLASAKARVSKYDGSKNKANDEDESDDDGLLDEDDDDEMMLDDNQATSSNKYDNQAARTHDKSYKQVIENSDIILYVLDARDPNAVRSREIEREVLGSGDGTKRLIFILNKIDLIPPAVLKSWLNYLRNSFPTLPLRASTPAPNAKTYDHKSYTIKGTSESLLRALKSYAQTKQLKRGITVGILGYPNVGKSSVINALTSRLASRAASTKVACPVGAEAGITTAIREIKLDNKLKLLDSPGIVFPTSNSLQSSTGTSAAAGPLIKHLTPKQLHDAHLTLLTAIPPSAISDPISAVALLLHRLSTTSSGSDDATTSSTTDSELLSACLSHYSVSSLSTLVPSSDNGDVAIDFLVHVARKRGRLGKGGVPNINAAAMGVLADWRDGRIRGWAQVPALSSTTSVGKGGDSSAADANEQKKIVQEWGKEFKLDGLWGGKGGDNDVAVDGMES